MTLDLAPFIIPALIFVGVLSLGLMVGGWVAASSARFSAVLDAEHEATPADARVIRALGTAFRPLGAPFGNLTEWLDEVLIYAGRPYGGISGREYMAAAIVLSILVGMGVGAFFGFASIMGGNPLPSAIQNAIVWAFFTAPGIGAYLLLDIKNRAAENSEEIEREFPFFLDLAVLVVQAGGTPLKALHKYVEASPGTALAKEIAITAKDADATSFEDALYRLIDRIEPNSVKVILKNLAQGEKTSGEAEHFYAEQAEELRYLREEMANRTAERLRTNIVFPVFLMLTGIIVAALAPTIVSIRAQGFF